MWTFQLSVQVEAEELMETLGICGSFDQDVTNDLTDKDNNIHKVLNILKVCKTLNKINSNFSYHQLS